ncbi:hypothetical protein HPY31_07470 [Brevibacillus sp. HB1.3]|uniref:hypothetical protein n=1 Tax=Brevibacillus sp. HB1.3 TaxID=2738842 RepID=UPI001556F761|nr:hypothetical protein [Brevibacillus sp. HB1.3]NQF13764.1 hypothetical protein [Brevibacillus sp. HB1.3]
MVKKWGILGLALLISIYAIYLQIDKKELESRLEIISGYNLHLLFSSYNDLATTINSDKQKPEIINDTKNKLDRILQYSSNIDSALGRGDLKTIAYKFKEIFSHPDKIYTSGNKTEELVEITGLLQELNEIINDTYYDKTNDEGGKAELYIKDFDKMDAYIEKLTNYTEQFTQK